MHRPTPPAVFVSRPAPQWRCEVLPGGAFVIFTAQAPNAVHRLIQRLVLGFRWSRLPQAGTGPDEGGSS